MESLAVIFIEDDEGDYPVLCQIINIGDIFTEIKLLTNYDGENVTPQYIKVNNNRIKKSTVNGNNIILKKYAYQQLYADDPDKYKASIFLKKNETGNITTNTTSNFLGSGIYCLYYGNYEPIDDDIRKFFRVDFSNPYILIGKDHGNFITHLGMQTSYIMQKFLQNGESGITEKDIQKLVNLWNVTLLINSRQIITAEFMLYIMKEYYQYYKNTDPEKNYIEQPIGRFFKFMGYDGLLANDDYNNSFSRGCVNYNYTAFNHFIEDTYSRIFSKRTI